MINLLLMKEFKYSPVSCCNSKFEVDLLDLPISDELRNDISEWDKEFQDTYDSAHPFDSEFENPKDGLKHVYKGVKLARRLQAELGEAYSVKHQA